jgi:hypothetical protein
VQENTVSFSGLKDRVDNSFAKAICITCLQSLLTVARRKPTALQLFTEQVVKQLLLDGVDKLGEHSSKYEDLLLLIFELACTVTETLAREQETLMLISPSMRVEQGVDIGVDVEKEHELMPVRVLVCVHVYTIGSR